MIDLVPTFIHEKKEFVMGLTSLQDKTIRPLETGYNTLFICQTGWAVVSLYNKKHLLRAGDVLNANWDMRPVFLKVSADFSTYYCLMAESFFYDVFRGVSGSFCDFTYTYPILRVSSEQSVQLSAWLQQLVWIDKNSSDRTRNQLVKYYMHSLFIFIDAELQKIASVTPLLPMPRAMEIIREFGSLLEKYSTTNHNVSFYADKLSITPYYLSTITAEIMQDTPKGLIDKQVIQEMKVILSTTNAPLKTIAEQMNFEDVSYMCRFFRRHTGMSPTEFRK